MSTPRNAQDVDCLIDMGFTHLLTLTEESPLNPAWVHMKPIKHVYIPVPNYRPPTIEEMDVIFDRVQDGGTWLIHCGGSVGRAGTVLACLMTMLGPSGKAIDHQPQLDANTTISLLRKARPRSLETEYQEKFVATYVSHRWKAAFNPSRTLEPLTTLSINSNLSPSQALVSTTLPTVIFLVGKPGSGKSWLASAIAKRRDNTVIISQDGDGRAACERQLGQAQPSGTLVIFDRCNPKAEERADWLKLIPNACQCIAVFFEYDKELCQRRINTRLNHPTIRPGRGKNALDQMDREMAPPTLDEGFAAVLTVSSFSAAKEAVRRLSPTPPLLKFPGTPHLLDTGTATADDIILEDFTDLTGTMTIEEKIDGANMGFSLDFDGAIQCQNRSHWVNSADHVQFKPLDR